MLFFVYKSFQKRVSCENALFSLMKIVSKITNIGALNSGYNYVISGRFFDPNRLGRAKFADLFLENESEPLHERCAFVFQTLL